MNFREKISIFVISAVFVTFDEDTEVKMRQNEKSPVFMFLKFLDFSLKRCYNVTKLNDDTEWSQWRNSSFFIDR